MMRTTLLVWTALVASVDGFGVPAKQAKDPLVVTWTQEKIVPVVTACVLGCLLSISPVLADTGASSAANAKLTTGGASTLQSGRTISITRGVNLDGSDFSNQNLKGVAFQQSVVRDADFSKSNLVGASFFDATLDGSNFEDSDMVCD